MADQANVSSTEAIQDARVALVTFIEEGKNALGDVDFEVRRTLDWVANERRMFWNGELKKAQQRLVQAKSDLARKKLGKFGEHRPDTSVEEDAVDRWKKRIALAEHKVELVRRWGPQLERAVEEYRGAANPLASLLTVDMARGLMLLDRMLTAIDAYSNLSAPSSGMPPRGASSGTGAASSAGAPTAETASNVAGDTPEPATIAEGEEAEKDDEPEEAESP